MSRTIKKATVETITKYSVFSKLDELQDVKDYIKKNLLYKFKLNQYKLTKSLNTDFCSINDDLMEVIENIIMRNVFFQKNKVPYSPSNPIFEEELSYIRVLLDKMSQAIDRAKKWYGSQAFLPSLEFFYNEFYDLIDKEHVQCRSTPVKHYFLFALSHYWKKNYSYNLSSRSWSFLSINSNSFDKDLKQLTPIIPVIEDRFTVLFKDLSFQNCALRQVVGDHVIHGNCEMLMDDIIVINKNLKSMRVTTAWLLQIFFCAYLHNKKSNIENYPHKIKKFAFLNWRCSCFQIKEYVFSDDLIHLFDELYKAIAKQSGYYAGRQKNDNTSSVFLFFVMFAILVGAITMAIFVIR